MQPNVYDLLMLVVLGGATVFGFWKGMAWQIASLASLVVSYFAALRFSEQLAPMISDEPWNRFAAMLLIYAGVSFVIWMLFRLVAGVIDKVKLESFDRQMGAIIGFAKGVLLCVAITFFAVGLLSEQEGQAIVASKSGQGVVWVVRQAHSVFPPEMHEYLHKIEERLDPNLHPGGASQAAWPGGGQSQTQTQSGSGWPQISWPQSQSQSQSQPSQELGWPYSSGSQSGRSSSAQPAQAPPERNPYSVPREPNPFPGPYSAEVPTSRDY